MTAESEAIAKNVTFDADGCTLAGTFTAVSCPVAAALMITGSGKTNRDSDVRLPGGLMLRGRITRACAEVLAAEGVSSLRYDKRASALAAATISASGCPSGTLTLRPG